MRELAFLLFLVGTLSAQNKPAGMNLATVMPSGTSYHQTLQQMGQAWRQAPGGGVSLTLFTGSSMGGEADIVRRMRQGQLQAGMLSVVGLSDIDQSVTALSYMPMMFRSLDELDYVRDQLRPELEKRLLEKGFVTLFWGDAGWVRFFTRQPISRPADLRRLKLFAWAGDSYQIDLMKDVGFQPVPLETSDILPGLQTGLISAVSLAPFFALATQVYGPAPHMLDMNWGVLVGATVVNAKTWESIPTATREVLQKAADTAGVEMRKRGRQEAEDSVQTMVNRGLKAHPVTSEIEAEWRQIAEDVYPRIRGKLVPADMFDKVQRLLADYRANNAQRLLKEKRAGVRLAAVMPSGASYHQILEQMGQAWRKAPGGGVNLTISPESGRGGEADIVRRLRQDQLEAGMLSTAGLSDIDKSVTALSYMPMMFRSLDELDYVRDQLRLELEKRLLEKGFVTLFWGDAGWVRFFTKQPISRPADLRKLKLFAWAGDNYQIDLMKAVGFQPVALETSEILPGLQDGRISAVSTAPFYALAAEVYRPAPHMLDVNWGVLVRAAVITVKTWKSIAPTTRDALQKAADAAGAEMRKRGRQEAEDSVQTMVKRGLKTHPVTPKVEAEWRRIAEDVYPKIRGKQVPADMFDKVVRLLADYRARQGKPAK